MYTHQRLRSACTSAQSDQFLVGTLRVTKVSTFLQEEKDSSFGALWAVEGSAFLLIRLLKWTVTFQLVPYAIGPDKDILCT